MSERWEGHGYVPVVAHSPGDTAHVRDTYVAERLREQGMVDDGSAASFAAIGKAQDDYRALSLPVPVQRELPTEPGVYSQPCDDKHMSEDWKSDGIPLFMLNRAGNWIDVGWGIADARSEGYKVAIEDAAKVAENVTRDEAYEIGFSMGHMAGYHDAIKAQDARKLTTRVLRWFGALSGATKKEGK